MKKSLLLFLMAFMVIATINAQDVNFKNFTDKTVDVEINYPLCKNDKFSVEPGKTVSKYRGACTITQITATGAEPYTSPGTLFSEFGLIKFNDKLEVHHLDASGNPLDLPGGGYPRVTIVNKTNQTLSGKIKYLSVFGLCKDDSYSVAPGQTFTPIANRGLCLLTEITGTSQDGKSSVIPYTSSGTSFSKFGIVTNPVTEEFEAHRVDDNGVPCDIKPGFIIRNKTEFPVEVSLDQVGCLYHGVIMPNQVMERNTGGVWFTINYQLNMDGTPKIDDFKDCVLPVADVVASSLLAAVSGGASAGIKEAAKQAAKIVAKKFITETAAKEMAKAGLKQIEVAVCKAFLKKGVTKAATSSLKYAFKGKNTNGIKSMDQLTAQDIKEDLEEKYSGKLYGQYAGSPLGLYEKPTYEITNGPTIDILDPNDPTPTAVINTVGGSSSGLCITKVNTVGDDMMELSSKSKCDPNTNKNTPTKWLPQKVDYYHEVEVTNYTKVPQEVFVTYQDRDNHQTRHEQDKFTVAAGAKGSPDSIRKDFLIDNISSTYGKSYTPSVGAKPADYKFGIIDVGDEKETYEIYPLDTAGKPLNLSASTKATYVEVGNYHNVVFYNKTNAQVTVTVNYTDGTKDQFTVNSQQQAIAAGIRGRRLITSVAATGAGVKDYSAVNCASFVGTNYRFGLGDKKQVSRSQPGGYLLNEPAPPNGVDLLLLSTTYDNDIYYPNKAVFKNSVPVGVKWFVDQSKDQTLLVSSNAKYSLVLNSRNGNNILLKNLTTTIWSTRTNVYDGFYFVRFQYDGNLVVWDDALSEVWSANCGGQGGKTLKLEDDGSLVIYDAADKAIWSKGIDGKTTMTTTPTTGCANTSTAATPNSVPAGTEWKYCSTNDQTLLKTNNGIYKMIYRKDGVVDMNIKQINIEKKTMTTLKFQLDGNLVLYGSDNAVLWSANCSGKGGKTLMLDEDGRDLKIYDVNNKVIWSLISGLSIIQAQPTKTSNSAPVRTTWTYSTTDQTLLTSTNGNYILVYKADGNLALNKNSTYYWRTNILGSKQNAAFKFEYDGNLNLYFTYNERTSNTSAWSANCSGKGGKTLKLEDDGNLVVYDAANKAIWSSGTNGK